MTTDRLDSTPTAAEHVVAQKAGDEAVLLELAGGRYFSLDPVGSRIWALCDGRRSVRKIAAEISREYDADLHTVERDVAELLEELEREQLVRFA